MTTPPAELPRWMDWGLLPLLNLALALAVCAGVAAWVGLDPGQVLAQGARGAFGSRAGIGYTLYYATSFVFTGLAVAVALHGGLFNIGGEGQALLGGLGCTAVALACGDRLPAALLLPLMVAGAAAAGAAWAAVPAALQAWRGSHVVITTIMANFLASALVAGLLVHVLRPPGSMTLESAPFPAAGHLPAVHPLLQALGLDWPATPLNLSVLLAAAAALGVHALLFRTAAGYELRATGCAPLAAQYAGVRPRAQVMGAMAVSGALAGLVGVNELAGVQHRLLLDFVAGAGFTGIAVALIGRKHPLGIVLASLLFGALHQGGAELAFEVPGFSRELLTTLQGLVVLFAGALGPVAAPALARLHRKRAAPRRAAAPADRADGGRHG